MKMIVFCFLFVFFRIIFSNPTCSPTKPGMINVHLISHSHDDLGWKKTFEQYYSDDYGWSDMPVRSILTTSIASLLKKPDRKFVYAESGYFFRWWKEQDENTKIVVKNLIKNGQLEFIGGGWCQNDEATPTYIDIIDQMTLGLGRLNETFGPEAMPRVAWQIDPFGHSKEQASLFAQMGMDGLIFSRIDQDDKNNRMDKKEMEFVWKGSNYLGEESWIFTGILPQGYFPPEGFCFDSHCGGMELGPSNKDQAVKSFIDYINWHKESYKTANLLVTMGGDFHYSEAESWFRNLDKLIEYVNERHDSLNINLLYSTPSCFLDALYNENLTWPSKTDDFFPYASEKNKYWTGYFTSRPTLKLFVRFASYILQTVKQISALSGFERGPSIITLAEMMGILLHHDAITGTANQYVAQDYSYLLSQGVAASEGGLANGFRILTEQKIAQEFVLCPLLNISMCPFIEGKSSFVVNVYNPIARNKSHYVRVPIEEAASYTVMNNHGISLPAQLVPLPAQVLNIPERNSNAKYELIFYAQNIPALGVKQYLISKNISLLSTIGPQTYISTDIKDIRFEKSIGVKKGNLHLKFDARTKKLKLIKIYDSDGTKIINVTQDWLIYGANKQQPGYKPSGHYIFRSNGNAREIAEEAKISAVYDGPLVSEVHQEWTPWITQVTRLYKNKNYVEMEWLVGPLPYGNTDQEIVNRLEWGEMITDRTFYTDANGRELQKRIVDYRETWELDTSNDPVSRNYYPVTSRLILQSTNEQGKAAILNDRAQGGTSLSDGQMELMVQRKCIQTDNAGLPEPLNETGLVARGRHYLVHSSFSTKDCDFGCQHRTLGEELFLQPVLAFSDPSSYSISDFGKKSGLADPLPPNLRLLTLEPWTEPGTWLLRLENFYEPHESSLSGRVDFNIREMFTDWQITDIREVYLGANAFKDHFVPRKWKTTPDNQPDSYSTEKGDSDAAYSFYPMQIRSFIVKVVRK